MKIVVHDPQYLDEPDRATINANDIVVDVIANEDGSVYVECYSYESGKQAVVQHSFINRYETTNPNFRLELADKPDYSKVISVRYCDTYDPVTQTCTHETHGHGQHV